MGEPAVAGRCRAAGRRAARRVGAGRDGRAGQQFAGRGRAAFRRGAHGAVCRAGQLAMEDAAPGLRWQLRPVLATDRPVAHSRRARADHGDAAGLGAARRPGGAAHRREDRGVCAVAAGRTARPGGSAGRRDHRHHSLAHRSGARAVHGAGARGRARHLPGRSRAHHGLLGIGSHRSCDGWSAGSTASWPIRASTRLVCDAWPTPLADATGPPRRARPWRAGPSRRQPSGTGRRSGATPGTLDGCSCRSCCWSRPSGPFGAVGGCDEPPPRRVRPRRPAVGDAAAGREPLRAGHHGRARRRGVHQHLLDMGAAVVVGVHRAPGLSGRPRHRALGHVKGRGSAEHAAERPRGDRAPAARGAERRPAGHPPGRPRNRGRWAGEVQPGGPRPDVGRVGRAAGRSARSRRRGQHLRRKLPVSSRSRHARPHRRDGDRVDGAALRHRIPRAPDCRVARPGGRPGQERARVGVGAVRPHEQGRRRALRAAGAARHRARAARRHGRWRGHRGRGHGRGRRAGPRDLSRARRGGRGRRSGADRVTGTPAIA